MAADPPEAPEGSVTPSQPDFREAMAQAMRRSGLGRVAPDQAPSAATLLTAMGGVLGIVESILPVLLFLITYSVTHQLLWSVIAPMAIAVVFVVIRLIRRQSALTAVAGIFGVILSSVFALLTGKLSNFFVLGLILDAAILVGGLISFAVRRPLLGVLASLLLSDPEWRNDRAQVRVASVATWLWIGMAVLRLSIQVPLYVLGLTGALATARLVEGVPLYALVLWLTWLVMRTAWTAPERVEDDAQE